jgi:recombinational DNA repair protein RecR
VRHLPGNNRVRFNRGKYGTKTISNQNNTMICSRCHSATPSEDCYVCHEPQPDEPDAFLIAKAAAIDQEIDAESPLT